MISAVAEPLCCMEPSIKFLIKRIWFGRRYWLKNSKMAVKYLSIFHMPGICHQVYAQEDMVWKMMFEEFQDGCSMMDPL